MRFSPVIAAILLSSAAFAVEPSEMLKDPALEARAREVSKELRCVQCQNETIDESNAEIARDMRLLVRERIMAGETNDQIMAYMTSRYGDYVRLEPRFMPRTYLLWFGPLIVLLLGGWAVTRRLSTRLETATELSEEEIAELARATDHGYPPPGYLHEKSDTKDPA
ncbi:MAG: cytochrome c-type biogenesis protein CcmH [Rhodospirillaceae bacterium]|nr:cytochrome c-type biogenesis protein CcmH [Rhodospirillaceae bacterium]